MADNTDIDSINQQLEQRVDSMMSGATVPGAPALPKRSVDPVTPAATIAPSTVIRVKEPTASVDEVSLDTPESDAAIDDIVAQEADQVLAAEDAGILANQDIDSEPASRKGHPIFWFIILLLVIIAAITAFILTSPGLELHLPS